MLEGAPRSRCHSCHTWSCARSEDSHTSTSSHCWGKGPPPPKRAGAAWSATAYAQPVRARSAAGFLSCDDVVAAADGVGVEYRHELFSAINDMSVAARAEPQTH